MRKKQLSDALRKQAEQINQQCDSLPNEEHRAQARDNAELINVLARVVERDDRPES